jgi:hypothetical protein
VRARLSNRPLERDRRTSSRPHVGQLGKRCVSRGDSGGCVELAEGVAWVTPELLAEFGVEQAFLQQEIWGELSHVSVAGAQGSFG